MPVRLNGSTSGYTELAAPAEAGNNSIALPTGNGNAYQIVRNGATAGSLEYADKLVSGTAVASTSGTSIDFTGIPSWVKRITVMFSGVSTNGTSPVQIQIGTSSGIDITGYSGSASNISTTVTTSNNTSGFRVINSMIAAVDLSGPSQIVLFGSNIWVQNSVLGTSDVARTLLGGGAKPLTGTLDRVRITTVNGTDTFDAGSINIMYE